jgi:hypothetical protein
MNGFELPHPHRNSSSEEEVLVMRCRDRKIKVTLVLFALLALFFFAESQPAAAQSWTQLAPTGTPPSPRTDSSAVYDPATNRMVMFGGILWAVRLQQVLTTPGY